MKKAKFHWLCLETNKVGIWEIPCENCDRSCDYIIKVPPFRYITPEVKKAVISRDKKCLKCESFKKLTIDHIIPISKGGTNDFNNLQTLCETCNSEKGDKIIDYR